MLGDNIFDASHDFVCVTKYSLCMQLIQPVASCQFPVAIAIVIQYSVTACSFIIKSNCCAMHLADKYR